MKKYVFILMVILAGITACVKPEEGLMPAASANAQIVRFRIYQNQNIFFDGIINNDENNIIVTIPAGIDKTTIYPQILISTGSTISPASGTKQDFTNPVRYDVISENGQVKKTYEVSVIN